MNPRTFRSKFILSTLTLGGISAGLTGCVAVEEHDHHARRYPVEERTYPVEERRYPVEERVEVAPEPVYEPAPREAVVVYERDLGPHGHWVETRDYGRCWVPNDRPRGWQPYTVGHWVDTQDGWCWVAEDREAEWGAVTYHYGRWYEDSSAGWVWVPGTTWAPAWVAWRGGDRYCGWAPLPPQVGYGRDITVTRVDRYVPADRYVYCEQRYMDQPRVYDHYSRGDVTIINRTTNITNITVVNNRVVNRGVTVEQVERSSGRRVQRVELAHAATEADVVKYRQQGRPVVYQPPEVVHADVDYRQRVERRQAEAVTAENDKRNRVERRNTDTQTAQQKAAQDEKDRVNRRNTEAVTAETEKRDRIERRGTDAQTAQQKAAQDEKDRVARRNADAQTAQQQEKDRVSRRATDADMSKQQERDRVARRAQEDAQAEKDRAAKAETDTRNTRSTRRPAEPDTSKEKPADKPAARTGTDRTGNERTKVEEKPAEPTDAKHTRTRTEDPKNPDQQPPR